MGRLGERSRPRQCCRQPTRAAKLLCLALLYQGCWVFVVVGGSRTTTRRSRAEKVGRIDHPVSQSSRNANSLGFQVRTVTESYDEHDPGFKHQRLQEANEAGPSYSLVHGNAVSTTQQQQARKNNARISRRTYSYVTNSTTRDTIVQAVENYATNASQLRFGIINTGSAAFTSVEQGWDAGCREYGVSCYYVVSNGTCLAPRTTLLKDYIQMGLDGIALKPCDDPIIQELFEEANAAGIPVITFDSDVTNATRDAFIGTDNYFLGNTLARLMRQLRPEGGTFCFVGTKDGRNEGFRDMITRYNNRTTRMGKWYEVPPAPNADELEAEGDWLALMGYCASHNPTGMVMVYQSPMRNASAWEDFVVANQWRNITYIGTDAADYQLDLLNRRLVDGLVGQLPYEIGELAAQVLFEKATTGTLQRDFYPTNLVSYNLIPIELPPITVDQNLLGNLTVLGYICFALIVVASVLCAGWTRWNRRGIVVKAAQPIFLHMVAGGTIILSSAIIPLSMDVSDEQYDATPMSYRVGICMSVPWLAFTGLTVVFAALFTKTWRVTRLFKDRSSPFAREQIAVRDVLAPFAVLLACNFIVLICWTAIDPLTYTRVVNEGTDYWNRILSTYGVCQSDQALDYLIPLAIINVAAVVIAAWQAYRARDIEDEFSESKYIGLAIYSMLQAFLTGVPVIAVVKDSPQSYYVVLTMIIFILCLSWLLLIFLPKLLLHRKYSKLSEREQRQLLLQKVRDSAGTSNLSFGTPSLDGHSPGDGGGSGNQGSSISDASHRRSSQDDSKALEPIEEGCVSSPLPPVVSAIPVAATGDSENVREGAHSEPPPA